MFGDLGLRPEMLFDLAINLANIVIMFLIVRFLVYKPVRKFMNARAQKAENEKKEADAKLEEALKLKEEYTLKQRKQQKKLLPTPIRRLKITPPLFSAKHKKTQALL